ncbi:MAG: hypothetical protein HY698_21630 [Deltaproteobacteria bacterium]|nr:hypothetical protein [Deltaproteobacteria bacterium]
MSAATRRTAKSPKRGLPRRKRVTEKREVITLGVRVPGTMTATALDLMVPILSPPGERKRRMLALAARARLGDNTQVLGLRDLGSELPQAFGEAFTAYNAFYSADWQHQRKYVKEAAAVLTSLDAGQWERSMRDAIWSIRCTSPVFPARPGRASRRYRSRLGWCDA